jgi:hypothetical protein
MLIVSSLALASALLASAALTGRPLVTAPPLVVGVTVVSKVSPAFVSRVLKEAADIWRAAGLAIVWQGDVEPMNANAAQTATGVAAVRVTIGNYTGGGLRTSLAVPLGWIVFTEGAPAHEIYVSYANAIAMLDLSRDSIARSDRMPRAERDALLGRALGRALAHELGHYLLASKAHSESGLMRARLMATEFFSADRSRFDLDAQQRAAIAGRMAPPAAVAALPPSVISRLSTFEGIR